MFLIVMKFDGNNFSGFLCTPGLYKEGTIKEKLYEKDTTNIIQDTSLNLVPGQVCKVDAFFHDNEIYVSKIRENIGIVSTLCEALSLIKQ